jgi:thiol-disulfide isomerase/thioredoxin
MEKRNLYISWTLRVLLCGLFVFSAITKMLPLTPFEKQLVDLGFADWHTAPYYARLIIGIELGLGIALIQNHFFKRLVIPLTALLLVAFCIHLSYQIAIGQGGNCGCFGQFIEMTPTEALIKNIVTLVFLGWLFFISTEKKSANRFSFLLLIWSFSTLFMFMAFPFAPFKELSNITVDTENIPWETETPTTPTGPVDNTQTAVIATPTESVNPGPAAVVSKFSKLNVFGGMKVKIDEGKRIVCFFIPGCDHCREAAKAITELSKDPNFPKVYIYFGDEEVEKIDEFFQVAGKKYPYQVLGMGEFFTLMGPQGETPGILYLWNGNIQKSYFGEQFNKEDLKNTCNQ